MEQTGSSFERLCRRRQEATEHYKRLQNRFTLFNSACRSYSEMKSQNGTVLDSPLARVG